MNKEIKLKPIVVEEVIELSISPELLPFVRPPNDSVDVKVSWEWTDFFGKKHTGSRMIYKKLEI